LVIVFPLRIKVVFRTSTLSGITMATLTGIAAAARQAATGFALRATPSATCRAPVDLHHFLGHQPALSSARRYRLATPLSEPPARALPPAELLAQLKRVAQVLAFDQARLATASRTVSSSFD
jgi:hypothetical protein